MSLSTRSAAFVVAAAGLLCLTPAGNAQAPAAPAAPAATQAGQPAQPPPVVSQDVAADRHITFRIYAPKAQVVRLSGGDIPGVGQGVQATKAENGVWEATVGPVEPGAYRYSFNVDGVTTIDRARGAWSTCPAPTTRTRGTCRTAPSGR